MPVQLDRDERAIETLKEAFESGRDVILRIPGREEPMTGCVSCLHEGVSSGERIFSVFVGNERVEISRDWNALKH